MAADLNPSDATIRLWLGWNLIAQQRFFEADEELASAERLDPTSLITVADRGYAAYFQGDLERAIDHFRRAVDLDANYPPSRFNLARALLRAGRVDEARAQIDALSRIVPTESAVYQMFLGCVLARSGQMVDARRIYNDLRDLQRNGEFMSPNFTATLAIELGETDEAISDIERLLDERNEYVPYLRSAPEFEKIRSDPRFELVLIAAGI